MSFENPGCQQGATEGQVQCVASWPSGGRREGSLTAMFNPQGARGPLCAPGTLLALCHEVRL